MNKYNDFLNEEQEEVELAGKHAFELWLGIIDDVGNEFTKQNYLNTSTYSYFFTTDPISDNMEVVSHFELKQSLNTAYKTLLSIKHDRVSFYFGVRGFKLEYGFFDEIKMLVYKVGIFSITTQFLKNLDEHDCLSIIKRTFRKSNLTNLNKLHEVKKDFESFWNQIEGKVEIMDEKRIKKSFSLKYFNTEDRDEAKMSISLEKWSFDFPWRKSYYYYAHITEKLVHLYIKIKEKEVQLYEL